MNRPRYIVVHHTGGTDANPLADTSHHTFEIVDNHHRRLWNFRSKLGHYIGYHYFIDKNGKVTQGRADNEEGAHTRGYNSISIGVCLAGNFDATDPTEKQIKSLTGLLKKLSKVHNIQPTSIVPHRRFSNKTCYGRRLKDDWAQNLVTSETDERTPLTEYTIAELFAELRRRIAVMRR